MYRFIKQVVDILRCLFPVSMQIPRARLFGYKPAGKFFVSSHRVSVTMLRIATLTLLLLGVSISGLPQQVGPAVGTDETGNCSFACRQDGGCEVSWAGPPR